MSIKNNVLDWLYRVERTGKLIDHNLYNFFPVTLILVVLTMLILLAFYGLTYIVYSLLVLLAYLTGVYL